MVPTLNVTCICHTDHGAWYPGSYGYQHDGSGSENPETRSIDKLSKKLGCEVVEISALKGTGIMKAAEKAISAAQSKKKTVPVHEFAQDVEDAIKSVENKLTGTVAERLRNVSLQSNLSRKMTRS